MKKVLLLYMLLPVMFLNIQAQNSSWFSFNGGVSIPLGPYSSNNLEDGAFTTSGISLGADGAWYFYKNIGLGADFTYSLHSVDAAALATQTLEASNDPLLNDLYVRSDPYKAISILLGFYYHYPLLKRLSVEPRALAGLMVAYTPFQLYETEYFLLGDDYSKKTSSQDQSFAYKLGLSIKYDIGNCLALKVSGDYSFSKMSFGFRNSEGRYFREQKISFSDISLGLVYKL